MDLEDLGNLDETRVRRSQFDVNLMGRIGIPATKVAGIGEAGVSFSPKFDGLGYNFGLGAEYRLFKLPLMKFYLGLEGQYVNFPSTLNGVSTDNKSARLLLYLGADFGV